MNLKSIGCVVAGLLAFGAHAQGYGGSTDASGSSMQQTSPSARSMPSRPSGPSGPTVSGDVATPGAAPLPGTPDPAEARSIGGSGSAGLAAMGGADAGSSATNQMGAGAMTDCPMGTSRKMGLCVPYGHERKKQP